MCMCINEMNYELLFSSSYTKLVSKGMEKAELIIKVTAAMFIAFYHPVLLYQVVMTPHNRAQEFVESYLKITEQDLDITNFQRVLEMKVCTHVF